MATLLPTCFVPFERKPIIQRKFANTSVESPKELNKALNLPFGVLLPRIPGEGGGGVPKYMVYIGMCRGIGFGFRVSRSLGHHFRPCWHSVPRVILG